MRHPPKAAPKRPASSVASRVFVVLSADLHYAKSIELGIANRSAIAAQLSRKLKSPMQAVKVAVTRWAQSQAKASQSMARRTSGILSHSTLHLQDDVCVLVVENNPATHRAVFSLQDDRVLSIVVSAKSITIIGPPDSVASVDQKLGSAALKRLDGLCLLQLSSVEQIEDVPGVYAAVLDALARKGINVLESSSCYTDTNIVLKRADALRAFEALEDLCGKTRMA